MIYVSRGAGADSTAKRVKCFSESWWIQAHNARRFFFLRHSRTELLSVRDSDVFRVVRDNVHAVAILVVLQDLPTARMQSIVQ